MNKTEYFVFHKEWYELKKELSAKAWIELEDYMLQLRFDGIDTDPKSIKNKTVRLQWIMIRKKIYDSINNMNRQKKHRNQSTTDNNPPIEQNIPIEPNDDFKVEENNIPCNVEQQEEQINNSNNPKPEEDMGNPTNIIVSNGKAVIVNEPAVEYRGLSHVNPNIIPQEEFISDEQKYGSDVMDLIEDNPEIITALKSVVEYHSGDIDKEYQANMANTKIDQIVRSRNNDSDFVRRVEKFCADFITEYKEYIFNKNNNENDN